MVADSVLLVDDEVEFVETLAERMRARGLDVTTAHDGADALRKAEDQTFHAIVLDLAMPGMDGIETLRRLRAKDPDRQIILLTGQGSVPSAVEATQLGAMDYLEKPAQIDVLLDRIRKARARWLGANQKRAEEEISDILSRRGW